MSAYSSTGEESPTALCWPAAHRCLPLPKRSLPSCFWWNRIGTVDEAALLAVGDWTVDHKIACVERLDQPGKGDSIV
jgi:hypothetical protein